MSALVPHYRPSLDTGGILSGEPVSAFDWQGLAGLANFALGHGAQLIPWSAIGRRVAGGGSAAFHFYVGPKMPATERVWRITLRSETPGATATITAGSASAVTVVPPTTRDVAGTFTIREPLAAKTSTAAGTTLTVAATGGNVRVVACAMYEQTRAALDAADLGVELGSVVQRTPIVDLPNVSLAGVCDAYKGADARRAGLFHWATSAAVPITITGGSTVTLFDLSPPALAALSNVGDVEGTVTIAAYAMVNAGAGKLTFTADGAGFSEVLEVTDTSLTWITSTTPIDCEDITVDDGRRSARWEGFQITGADATATTLSIASISIIRAGSGPL